MKRVSVYIAIGVAAGVLTLAGLAPVRAQEEEILPVPSAQPVTGEISPEAARSEGTRAEVAEGNRLMLYDDALPLDDTAPRSPGMELPSSATQGVTYGDGVVNNPFDAPPVPVARSPEEIQREIREKAFDAAITGLLPMRTDEIRQLIETFDKTRQAVEVPVHPYPEPEVAVETISLDPGVKPPEIKVAVGHVTTVSVMDATGQPWPIQDVSWAGNFEVIEPEEGGNILRITPMSDFTYGNMSVRLLKLGLPVTFILKTHRDKVHYRFDARIAQFGPFAQMPIMEGGVSMVAGHPALSAVLDGAIPDGAERLDVLGTDSRTTAYRIESVTFVRTPLTLLSPGWTNAVSSADGLNVYTVANASVLLLSDKGKTVRARLVSERDAANDQ